MASATETGIMNIASGPIMQTHGQGKPMTVEAMRTRPPTGKQSSGMECSRAASRLPVYHLWTAKNPSRNASAAAVVRCGRSAGREPATVSVGLLGGARIVGPVTDGVPSVLLWGVPGFIGCISIGGGCFALRGCLELAWAVCSCDVMNIGAE